MTIFKNKTRSLTKASLALATISLLSGCIVIASPSHADVHEKKELTLTANSLKKIDIEAGAGGLIIKGSKQATAITVIADIYTSSKSTSSYDFELSDSGSTAFLVAKASSSGSWIGNSPHIDLVVTVPASMMLAVSDGSGEIEVTDIDGAISITDGSGGLSLNNIHNSVSIVDGSGGIELTNIGGSVDIEDGSGGITLNGIGGDLSIDDGSGSIYARGITGNAEINDGSGDLTVKKVTGIITLDDGSGDIDIEEAGGLKIIDSGSGGLKVRNVKGEFEIDS
jgi:DUF4097 and DUF4098 domain-containing protein YvlB